MVTKQLINPIWYEKAYFFFVYHNIFIFLHPLYTYAAIMAAQVI